MKIKCVIGGAYGDEGKGLAVDYFTSLNPSNSIVVRYNSGAQCSHTVNLDNGVRHVFGSVGSGSFNNVPTFLSRFFVFNPLLFYKEIVKLNHIGITPKVYIDPNAIVTLPYDILLNQLIESYRQQRMNNHGSCGIGFGESIERHESLNGFKITVKDLKETNAWERAVEGNKKYTLDRIQKLGLTEYFNNSIWKSRFDLIPELHLPADLFSTIEVANFKQVVTVGNKDIIFEGGQGLLLGMEHGQFPHITRSNTGVTNIVQLLKENSVYIDEDIEVDYILRSYLTRHGAGPFNEQHLPYVIQETTNVFNEYQQRFKTAPFDFKVLKTIQDDFNIMKEYQGGGKCKLGLFMTWMHVNEHNNDMFLTFDGNKTMSQFTIGLIYETNPDKLYFSKTPTRTGVTKIF